MRVDWLENIRTDRKMTHEDVADRAGISRHYYTMIANGKRRPSVEVAKRIGDAMDFDWTLFFEQESNISLQNYTA